MSKVEYQKVVRLSTWAVESNSSFHKMKVWLNISQRVKFQDDPMTGWVRTVWLKMVGHKKSRFQEPWIDFKSFLYQLIFSKSIKRFDIYIKKIIEIDNIVPKILISYDQLFSTKRFWLNELLDHLETSCADLYWAKLSFYEN